jgi:hypothetical protein
MVNSVNTFPLGLGHLACCAHDDHVHACRREQLRRNMHTATHRRERYNMLYFCMHCAISGNCPLVAAAAARATGRGTVSFHSVYLVLNADALPEHFPLVGRLHGQLPPWTCASDSSAWILSTGLSAGFAE